MSCSNVVTFADTTHISTLTASASHPTLPRRLIRIIKIESLVVRIVHHCAQVHQKFPAIDLNIMHCVVLCTTHSAVVVPRYYRMDPLLVRAHTATINTRVCKCARKDQTIRRPGV